MSANNESSVVSAAASADRESTEAGMGMPEALSGGLGVSSPAAPSASDAARYAFVDREAFVAQAKAAALTAAQDDDMCPNCLTPWKCNGPHRTP